MNEHTKKIKNKINKKIISSQIWFTKEENALDNYKIIQILDVDEAKPKEYKKYNLNNPDYLIFENVYNRLKELGKDWNNNIEQIKTYYNNLLKDSIIIEKINNLINKEYNTDYDPDSADYFTFKLYKSISLCVAFKNIKEKQVETMEENWYNFLKIYIELIDNLNSIGNNLTYHQKIRIINCFCLYNSNILDRNKRQCRLFYIKDNLIGKNSYKLAINFNKNVIKNLNERSTLSSAFLQLDSFILKNYLIDEMTYSLTIEPLILMKNHLLLSYENFIFINYEESQLLYETKASQNTKNRITFINEKSLFNCTFSENLYGETNALPISMEFFHEKDSHSKKSLKNLHIISPIYCFKFNRNEKLKFPEDGKFVESIIGEDLLILTLKDPINQLGELMKIKYFTANNFDELKLKLKELDEINKEDFKKKYESQNETDSNIIEKKTSKIKKSTELKTLKDYENAYLSRGKFVYPDSIPFHSYEYGKEKEIEGAERDYLDKNKEIIEKAIKEHLMD